jgi:hypothetical protein
MIPPMMVGEQPHWEARFPAEVWPAFEDFRNFLALVWSHLGLPEPTPAQYEIAHRLQYGADSEEWSLLGKEQRHALLTEPRNDIVRAFRSIGKSYITAAFVIWRIMRNPRDEKVLVVSATGSKAKEFVDQVKGVLESLELVQWLLQGSREGGARRRDMADKFDVVGASISQSYSLKAVGINGQVTGSRATLLVADDIEIEANSKTEDARQRILNSVRSDFGPVTKTEMGKGDIIFLGTPQTEESVYNVLVIEMGYSCFCVPARFPAPEKLKNYVLQRESGETTDILAFYLRALHDDGKLPHLAPTDTRFGNEELLKDEAKGRAHFALQYMLDTSLSDAERYPLKLHDLIVFSVNQAKAPLMVQWGKDTNGKNLIGDIPNLGFSGDHLLRPLFVDHEWRDYEGSVLFVDPSGRGADETGWTIVKSLGGMLFVLANRGISGDPAQAMLQIALDAKRFNVNVIEVEPNFGGGMWTTAFQPVLTKVWPGGCTVLDSEWARGQKETRIIDTLEPVLTQHRLVVSEEVLREDAKLDERKFSLMFQLTHITRERGALRHDDRLDSLAGAVAHFMRTMAMDADQAREAQLAAEKDALIEQFFEDLESPFERSFGSHKINRSVNWQPGDDDGENVVHRWGW